MSSTLFLITCSGTKEKQVPGQSTFKKEHSITNNLSHTSESLIEGRQNALSLLRKSDIMIDGIKLSEHAYNEKLSFGADFNGDDDSARYLEARQLYKGRFYRELGENGLQDLDDSDHHLLIISGLYGLLSPHEYIQIYECNLERLIQFHNNWTRNDRLTDILLDYINSNGIFTVVDLTSQHEYRNLIYWKKFYEKADLTVLHAHNENFAGPQALINMATYLKSTLIPMKDADFHVKKTKVENGCCLTSSIVPPEGWPMEQSARIEKAIEEWETKTREFKASLTGGTRDFLPYVTPSPIKYRCMKSISALMNTDGGELFIGIHDRTRKVHGITADLAPYLYSEDQYLQVLDRMVLHYIGKLFVQNVRPEIWTYNNKPILRLSVQKGTTPAFLLVNESGVPERTFWIRYNNTQTRLKGDERQDYFKRFS